MKQCFRRPGRAKYNEPPRASMTDTAGQGAQCVSAVPTCLARLDTRSGADGLEFLTHRTPPLEESNHFGASGEAANGLRSGQPLPGRR